MNSTIPQHVVIIPDGNRRWAKKNLLSFWQGHEAGFKRVQELGQTLREAGVKHFTLWGFSTENWNRSSEEIQKLMSIFMRALEDLTTDVHEHQIHFTHLGRKDRLPADLLVKISELEEATKHYTAYYFNLALDYGGRDELLRAVHVLQAEGKPVTEESLTAALDTNNQPDPDFIIRTSGEMRLSGIMPWQAVYAELYFTPLMFPEFDANALTLALEDYATRQRRFGK